MSVLLTLIIAVVGLNLYALALILLRAPLYNTRLYRPMVLNIGLSLSPALALGIVVAGAFPLAVALESQVVLFLAVVIGGLVWLLLLPNSAYLITELNFSHRKEGEGVPLWYDIVMVLTLALSGVMNTLMNVLLAQAMFVLLVFANDDRPMSHPSSWVMVGAILLLVSFGMYLGRYLRFNSWDLKNPMRFIRKFFDHFRQPGKLRESAGFTLVHAILLALLYLVAIAPVSARLM